jgi:antitoxin ParD1/3/4
MKHTEGRKIFLGDMQLVADRLMEQWDYSSFDELMQDAVLALKREKDFIDKQLKAKIEKSLNDPRPPIPAEQVFRNLERFVRQQEKKHKAKV